MKRFIFSILVLCLSISSFAQGPQAKYSSEWVKQNYDKREVYITMRDGVKLFTSIYEPKDKSVKHPIMMERTCYTVSPYGEDNYDSFTGLWRYAEAGYIFVFQDVRGKNMSEGEFDDIRPFIENKKLSKKAEKNVGQTDEASDTYDTVEWIINNTNNNGCVGVKGISYPGFYTTMAALSGHPAIKAVSPQAPVTDWFMGDDVHHNGAYMFAETVSFLPFFEFMMGNKYVKAGIRDFNLPELEKSDVYTDMLEAGTYSDITKMYADSITYLRTIREHPDLDEYWLSHTVSKGHLHDVMPAVMVVGGLFDKEDCYGALDVYKTIHKESPETDLYFIEGPWYHGGWSRGATAFWKYMYFGDEATSDYYNDNFEYPFFAYYLEGKGEKPAEGAHVFDSGSRKWNFYEEWPLVDVSETTPFYLHSDGSVSCDAPSGNGVVSYISDPNKPVPYHGEIESGISKDYMIADQRFASQRTDVVCFETEPLAEELTLYGEVEVELHVDISSTDADFVVKVIDVFPAEFNWYDELGVPRRGRGPEATPSGLRIPNYVMGNYQLMVRGEIMRGKYRKSFSDPKPFVPGETTTVCFKMPDVSHTFKPGHKLMIQVQSSWFPLVDRNPQTFCNIYTCDESAYQEATINIHCDENAASCVKLPIKK